MNRRPRWRPVGSAVGRPVGPASGHRPATTPELPPAAGCRDRGSASLWLLGIGLAVIAFAMTAILVAGLVVARHRARNAADLGALAGASLAGAGEGVACARADRIVAAAGGRMVACRLAELDLLVTVEVDAPAGFGDVRATARAGQIR